MKKVAYIIPGYDESHKRQRGYNAVANLFKARGIHPIHVNINWKRKERVFEDVSNQFLKNYKRPKNAEIYILGFSFGAVAALLSAPKAKPNVLILCSLSPYFIEDQKALRPQWLRHWKKRFANNDYSFNELARKIKTRTFIVAGDAEGPEVERRARAAKRLIKNSSLVIARGAKHSIGQKEYLIGVEKVIKKLL